MTRPIIPMAQMQRRLPEIGRIRTGAKTDKAMKALDTFRFTSSDQVALGEIAALYDGTVRPWSDPKSTPGQYEVVTGANEIAVALPPDPLAGTPVYELWTGGGCERRCDGVVCETWVKGPDGPEPSEMPCPCEAKGRLECDPKTRLNVILPNVRGIGTWRLETKSWNAAKELPGMVDLIQSLQSRGITRATLRLEHKQSMQAGVKRKFIVPVLGLDETVEALVAGDASVGTLAPAPVAQIGAGEVIPGGDPVDSGSGAGSSPATVASPAPSLNAELSEAVDAVLVDDDDPWKRHNPRARALAKKAGWDDDKWHEAVGIMTEGRSTSSKDMTDGEWADLLVVLEAADPDPDADPLAHLRDLIGKIDGLGEARVLKRARRIAEDTGAHPPEAFDEIDGSVLAAVVAEAEAKLAEQGAA